MCGRVTLTAKHKDVENYFEIPFEEKDRMEYQKRFPLFNGAPTHLFPVLSNGDERSLQLMQWGLIPFWAKDRKIGYKMINARIETVAEKPAFRQAFAKRRCLIAVDGYYEWLRKNGEKIPYRIAAESRGLFALCGLYETWNDPETEEDLNTFTIITMDAADAIGHIHDRMPFSVPPKYFDLWLNEEISAKNLKELAGEAAVQFSNAYRVSKEVNSVRNNYADLLEPVEDQRNPTLFDN
jgi:putative SOS response-associated peptidase YedK